MCPLPAELHLLLLSKRIHTIRLLVLRAQCGSLQDPDLWRQRCDDQLEDRVMLDSSCSRNSILFQFGLLWAVVHNFLRLGCSPHPLIQVSRMRADKHSTLFWVVGPKPSLDRQTAKLNDRLKVYHYGKSPDASAVSRQDWMGFRHCLFEFFFPFKTGCCPCLTVWRLKPTTSLMYQVF